MNPVITTNDTITAIKKNMYSIGDILLYPYMNGNILIHRLIRIDDSNYYCKGDNAYNAECVPKESVLGKAILINGEPLRENHLKRLIIVLFSVGIHKLFNKSGKSISNAQKKSLYKVYNLFYLKKK